MLVNQTEQFDRLRALENQVFSAGKRFFTRSPKPIARTRKAKVIAKRRLSPWIFFWTLIGGFYFSFQSFLWINALTPGYSTTTEMIAVAAGLVFGLAAGIIVNLFFKNTPTTDWRVPSMLFTVWMVLPAIFPVLFLAGLFLQRQDLVDLHFSAWHSAFEFFLFGIGLVIITLNYRRYTWTQGAATIALFSLLIIGKSLVTDGFYLSSACPESVYNQQFAWLSASAADIQFGQSQTKSEQFYHSPLGQFVCTRTREELFR